MNIWRVLFSQRYLWATNTVSSGVLLGFGDVIQQHLKFFTAVKEKKTFEKVGTGSLRHLGVEWSQWRYDFRRTWRMFLVGLSQGPPHHWWYTFLDKSSSIFRFEKKKIFEQVYPSKSLRTVGKKILADQLVAAPFFAVTFFLGMGYLEKKSFDEIMTEFVKKFPSVYAFDWAIWPPTQFINFVYVSAAYRVLYVNLVTVLWDVFLSYIKHYDQCAHSKMAAPFFAVTFFLGMGYLEKKSFDEIMTEFVKKFPSVYAFDWAIWPPTQFINFVYVSAAYRVLYVNLVTVLWDVFLSYIKHYDQCAHSVDFDHCR
ncbi:unnamed protein product, partial [Notodromas monacha]